MNDYNIHFTKPQVLAIPYPLTIVSTYTLPFHTGPGILLCGSKVFFFFTYIALSKKQSMRKISTKSVLSREHFQHVWYTWFVSVWNYLSDAFQSFFSSPSFSFSFRRFSSVFCLCSCQGRRLPSFASDRSFEKPECRQCSFGLKT